MSGIAKKLREVTFQILFSGPISLLSEEELVTLMMAEAAIPKRAASEALEKAKRILACGPVLDQWIIQASTSYSFERIQHVEKTVLRLATYELLYEAELPTAVIISEAIRIGKKFSTPEAAHFINALLDHIARQTRCDLAPSANSES